MSYLILASLNDDAATAESIVTGAAILVGGIWAYSAFRRQRERLPKCNLDIAAQARPFAHDTTLLSVEVALANVGKNAVAVDSGTMLVQQVLPVPPNLDSKIERVVAEQTAVELVAWPVLLSVDSSRVAPFERLEPGETASGHFDFCLPSALSTVAVFAHYHSAANRSGGGLGWQKTLLVDLHPEPREQEVAK